MSTKCARQPFLELSFIKVLLFITFISQCCFAQTVQRLRFTAITPSLQTGQDYSPWLSDDLNLMVQNAWLGNNVWVDITMPFKSASKITKLSLYDFEGVFKSQPALVYALKGKKKTLLYKFTGPSYMVFEDTVFKKPIDADAIVIHKISNNIPQKIFVYGYDAAPPVVVTPPVTAPVIVSAQLKFTGIQPSQDTGQDYSPWLSDDITNFVQNAWLGNNVWVDITLPFKSASKLTKLSLYDYEGVFDTQPALIYALKGTKKTLLYTFTGPKYMAFEDTTFKTPIDADAIVVHKISNNIPQKILAYGYADTTTVTPVVPPPVIAPPVVTAAILRFTAINPSQNTGQDYSPWLSDDLTNIVQNAWVGNNIWVDITMPFKSASKITKLSLYDYEGVFDTQPALIYALKGTQKTLLYTFTGPGYMTFEDTVFKTAIDADAIVVHKISNNIPQKIFAYGYADTTTVVVTPPVTTPPVTTPPVTIPNTGNIVKIPITTNRWYQLNNVSNGLDGLFDGITNVNVNTGYGLVLSNFDAYYPVADGEVIQLSKVKFFSYQGGLDNPMTLYIINSKGKKIQVGTFKGYNYNTWVGPYPDRTVSGDAQFNIDSTVTDIKYLVINSSGGYPTEMELYGYYTAPTKAITPPAYKAVKLRQFFGINAFEWNFENGAIDATKIDSTQTRAIKSFTQVRHYMDWQKLESDQGSFTYNPTRSGGWNYDAIYQYCKSQNIEVLADLKTIPDWLKNTYPSDQQDAENVPVVYGKGFSDPASYIEQAKVAFQYVARYGSNAKVDSSLLSVNGTPRWTADPINTVIRGMGLIKYIECDNERDKWWKGRKAYQTSYEYAANLSAFYDGNMNTMGAGVGVKNADASMQVVMGGLASADPSYVRGMVDWCKQHRGYRRDGSVNICWDVINYHLYSNDAGTSQNGNSTRGSAPEVVNTAQTAKNFVQMAHDIAADMPVWVTELGYDQNQGSPLKAIPIGNKTVAQVEADWILRSSLLYARSGVERIFFYQMYDDNALNPIQFGSSGLINDDKTRRASADYLYQTNRLLGEYVYKETVNSDPIIDHYDLNGKAAYAMVIPDEKGRTADYLLDLPGVDSAKVYTPTIGADSMAMQYVKTINGKLKITVTETPIFVIPIPGSSMAAVQATSLSTKINPADVKIDAPIIAATGTLATTLKLYPNPSVGYVNVSFASPDVQNAVRVRVLDERTGVVYRTFNAPKNNKDFSQMMDLTNIGLGVCVVEVKQGNATVLRKLIKIN